MLHLLALAVTAAVMGAPGYVPRPLVPSTLSESEILTVLESRERRVRAFSRRLQDGVDAGARRSPSFAELLRTIERSDVIVQIVEAPPLPSLMRARLTLGPARGEVRFVRIEVSFELRGDRLVALLAHELQHAVEIAGAPQVRTDGQLAELYGRIGFRLARDRHFDTHAAHDVEKRVLRELGTAPRRAAADARRAAVGQPGS